jgi:hypothetical protein
MLILVNGLGAGVEVDSPVWQFGYAMIGPMRPSDWID